MPGKQKPSGATTHIWRRRRDLNPGHIGGRRVLSPLHHHCSPMVAKYINDMLSLGLQVVGYMQSLGEDLNNKFTWSSFPFVDAHESSRGSYVVSGLMKPLSDSPAF